MYLVYHERFKNENANVISERFGAKHPRLKPEFIIVNDQIHGFKKLDEQVLGLEKFPIFIEIEFVEEDGEKFIEGIDIHAEANIRVTDTLSEVTQLATLFEKTVLVEHTRLLTDGSEESLVIYSKISEMYDDMFLDEDVDDGYVDESELTILIERYLVGFSKFLQMLELVACKHHTISELDDLYQLPGAS
ncbi:hypothetical protein EB093_01975 [bacterium]|nr:hypothetical protein [bacterium]